MRKATRKETKVHNRRLILNVIYNQQQISRADISRETGLTRSTVSDLVHDLIAEGLVEERGRGKSSGGKPPILLGINERENHVIGLDLASEEFRGAIINLTGNIEHRLTVPTDDESGDQALALVFQLVDQLMEKADGNLWGIGIGAPGLMNAGAGIVLNAVNLDWQDLALADILSDRYKLPVHIANDSQVSALAEYFFGSRDSHSDLVLIKVGRGVGSGIVLNEELYHGDGFGAGEIGHVKVDQQGDLCNCGHHGCLETKISRRAIQNRVLEGLGDHPESSLYHKASSPQPISLADIIRAYQEGDPFVKDVMDDVCLYLAKALSYVVSVLNTEQIVIGGSVSGFGPQLIQPISRYLHDSVLDSISDRTTVSISSLGENIVILGAVAVVLQKELGIVKH